MKSIGFLRYKFNGNEVLSFIINILFLLLLLLNKNPLYLILFYQNIRLKNSNDFVNLISKKIDLILIFGIGLRSFQLKSNELLFKFHSFIDFSSYDLILAESIGILIFVFFKIWIKRYLKGDIKMSYISLYKLNFIFIIILTIFLLGAGIKNQRGLIIFEIINKFIAVDLILYIAFFSYILSLKKKKKYLLPIILITIVSILTGSRYIFLFVIFCLIYFFQKIPNKSTFFWSIILFIIPFSLFFIVLISQTMRFGGDIYKLIELIQNTELQNIIVSRITMRFNIIDGILLSLNSNQEFIEAGLSTKLNFNNFILSSVEQLFPMINFEKVNSFGQIIGKEFLINENVTSGYGGALGIAGSLIILFRISILNTIFLPVTYFLINFSKLYKTIPVKIFFVDSLIFFLIGGNFDSTLVRFTLNYIFFIIINLTFKPINRFDKGS